MIYVDLWEFKWIGYWDLMMKLEDIWWYMMIMRWFIGILDEKWWLFNEMYEWNDLELRECGLVWVKSSYIAWESGYWSDMWCTAVIFGDGIILKWDYD